MKTFRNQSDDIHEGLGGLAPFGGKIGNFIQRQDIIDLASAQTRFHIPSNLRVVQSVLLRLPVEN